MKPSASMSASAARFVVKTEAWTETGLSGEEVAALLESEANRGAKIYRIERISPDGRMELRGVSVETFSLESGMFFFRNERAAAEADFVALAALAEKHAPPARGYVQLVDRGAEAEFNRFATALIYPAEHDGDFAQWLLESEYAGGDTVEGGVSAVSDYYHQPKEVLRRCQLWSQSGTRSRSRIELLAHRRSGAAAAG
ncbi:MAG: hypothetical protein SF069_04210 [Phycisphaerae bacterium]|nr:hypothetical protein [Phycisphaerae bacterium]